LSASRTALGAGYIALDVICHGVRVRQRAGGTATNVMAGLAYLGWNTAIIGRIGVDAPSRRIRSELRDEGVDVTGLIADPEIQTPVVVHEVRPPRHRFVFTCPTCGRGSARYTPPGRETAAEALERMPGPPDVVFADRVGDAALELFRNAPDALKMFEPSSRGQARIVAEAVNTADIVKWSHELRGHLHDVVLSPRGRQVQIESLGADGVRFRIGRSSWTVLEPVALDPLDTAGAGDWLTASFLDALPSLAPEDLDAEAVGEALTTAQQVAALSCLFVGARTLGSVPPQEMALAASALAAGSLSEKPIANDGRRSRAAGVCSVCLR
jgi:sugar/nucleoside kinase (ribokinase family)